MKISKFALGAVVVLGWTFLFRLPLAFAYQSPKDTSSRDSIIDMAMKRDLDMVELDRSRDQVKADLKSFKAAKAAHKPALIRSAKQKLEASRRRERMARRNVGRDRRPSRARKNIRNKDRRQIKRGR